jgi:hypothetical protein
MSKIQEKAGNSRAPFLFACFLFALHISERTPPPRHVVQGFRYNKRPQSLARRPQKRNRVRASSTRTPVIPLLAFD